MTVCCIIHLNLMPVICLSADWTFEEGDSILERRNHPADRGAEG